MKFTNLNLIAVILASMLSLAPGHAQVAPAAGAPAAPATAVNLTPAAADVLKLAQSGVGDDVVLPYVQNSQVTFGLSADAIVYLRDVGMSSAVITAMINHDNAAPGQPAANSQPPSPPAPAPASQASFTVTATGTTPLTYQWQFNNDANTSTDAPEDVNYFYSDMSPYGQWVDLQGYGWCWQPGVVGIDHQWQPYCDAGHWVYTDSGWFWQSDYSWGWAAFHYGRWLHHDQRGWVWFPDRVWSPAWVTWRLAGNDCGWAPLPLHTTLDASQGLLYNGVRVGVNFDFGLPASCFTFVGLGDFCAADLAHRRLAADDVDKIYNRATVLNNYHFANQAVFNGGIPVARITAVTHADIRPIHVADEPEGGGAGGNGRTDVVYRRTPRIPNYAVTMRAEKVGEAQPVVEHVADQGATDQRRSEPPNVPAPVRATEPPPARPAGHVDPSAPVVIVGEGADDRAEQPNPAIEPQGRVQYEAPHSARVAAQAHALPPLFRPHDEPPPEPPSKPMTHVPRSQAVANQAHVLPPLVEKPPPVELLKPGNSHPDAVTAPRDPSRDQH